MTFYDTIAADYDQITGQADRAEPAERFIDRLIERYGPASALDTACGQGLFTLPLARRGLRVLGCDISATMLEQAARKADQEALDVGWVCLPMQELCRGRNGARFDAVLCMGNSIPHLLTRFDLSKAMGCFASLAEPGGVVLIHLLNYARVLARGERIVGVARQGDKEFVRFYDLPDGETIRFNVLEIDHVTGEPTWSLHSTELRPWQVDELSDAAARAGLEQIERFGDLAFGPFDLAASDVLLLTARKP